MKLEIRAALVGVALLLSAGTANAKMTDIQIAALQEMVADGDILAIMEFWNANSRTFTYDTPLELALRDFVVEINQTGRASDIPETLIQATRDATGIY